jgi:hypothetical protein
MTTKKGTQKEGAGAKVDAATERQIEEFAHHLSEVLRIARDSDLFPVRFYNSLADAWNEEVNRRLHGSKAWDSEEYIRFVLAQKGGAK